MHHTIHNAFLTVTVAEHGAEMQTIRSADGTEYLWQGDPTYWADRAPNIFPYVARLTQGSYYLDGKLHSMNIHGIAPYADFHVLSKSDHAITLELTDSTLTRTQYPRHFSFQIAYALTGGTLSITFRVENRDEKTLYFGMGGHPGFRVPLEAGFTFEDYRLRFSAPCQPRRVEFTQDCYLTGQTEPFPLAEERFLPLRHDLFDRDAIVLTDMCREVTLESPVGHRGITVSFPDMAYLGIWHMPHTDAPYVCIEPWSSLPSEKGRIAVLETQADLLSLAPGEHMENIWQIRIR